MLWHGQTLTGRSLGRIFNPKRGRKIAMNLLRSITIRSNLGLKTQTKQLLGYLPLVIALPGYVSMQECGFNLVRAYLF